VVGGDYKQGRGTLKKKSKNKGGGPRFCCLGVLGECIYENFFMDALDENAYLPTKNKYSFELDELHLKTFGLSQSDQQFLVKANDTHRWSFKKIADHIEKNL